MGSVVFSVDAELGWGFSDFLVPPARINTARDGWRTLLEVFDTHDIPSTWAVVGHLFLEEFDGIHKDHPSIGGWLHREREPENSRSDPRLGADLISEVVDSRVDHELASHSFSHVLYGAPETTREMARADLEAAVETARIAGIEFDSFVFPRNAVGHRDLLAEYGFRCYRGAGAVTPDRLRRSIRKLLATAGVDGVDLVAPSIDEYGLVNVPPSLYLFSFEGWPRRIVSAVWDDPIVRLAKRGIDRACVEDGLFHLWLHPNNLVTERDVERVRQVVAYAADRRDRTDLSVETMADVAGRVLEPRPPLMLSG